MEHFITPDTLDLLAKKSIKHEQCFYCDALLRRTSFDRGDHFPIPDRNGGTIIIPCCQSCHDMKDNFKFKDWPVEWLTKVLEDFPKLSRETRIFLAKVIGEASDLQTEKNQEKNS
jgi:hypothetical protein